MNDIRTPSSSAVRHVRRRTLLAGAVAALALAGCGQTGPLYFPEDRLEEEKEKVKGKRSSLDRRRTERA